MLVAAVVAMPLVAVVWIAFSAADDSWRHVMTNVVPRATGRTIQLLLLTCLVTGAFGILTAWLVTTFDFPLRRLMSRVPVSWSMMPAVMNSEALKVAWFSTWKTAATLASGDCSPSRNTISPR